MQRIKQTKQDFIVLLSETKETLDEQLALHVLDTDGVSQTAVFQSFSLRRLAIINSVKTSWFWTILKAATVATQTAPT